MTRFVVDASAVLHMAAEGIEAYIGRTKMRLLGDAVLRKVAWEVADELGWPSTYDAEYIALTRLQADALVTLDPDLARSAERLVDVATIDALRA
jgi:predicted nucleic acid-binding protein